MTFPLGRPARLAVLASGRGSNMEALAAAFPPGDPVAEVVLVLSDRGNAAALETARGAGIVAQHVPWHDRGSFEAAAQDALAAARVDLVCLAGFMRLLSAHFVTTWAGRILNIHPSLLPKHRGLNPHRQALAEGAAQTGCSVHFVDAGMDTGTVVAQRSVPVLPGDTEETLAARVLPVEHALYPQAVRMVLSGAAAP